MNDEFSADEGQSEEGMQFARLNFDAEIEPCFFDEWITKRYGNGTILKEAIGNWIVTLSFSGIGHILKSTDPPPLWEVAESPEGMFQQYRPSLGKGDGSLECFVAHIPNCTGQRGAPVAAGNPGLGLDCRAIH
jgi:hypothetical protein